MALTMGGLQDVAQDLLACVCDSVDQLPSEVAGLAGCPCRTGVVPGQPAADGCTGGCDMAPGDWPGQLTVHVSRLYASDRLSFPNPPARNSPGAGVRDAVNCALPQTTAADLVVTLWRCAPVPDQDGCPPPMGDLAVSAAQLHADMLAVQRGILCCFAGTGQPQQRRGRRYTVGATTTLGPEGGCVGLSAVVTVALDDCLPCESPAAEVPLTVLVDAV